MAYNISCRQNVKLLNDKNQVILSAQVNRFRGLLGNLEKLRSVKMAMQLVKIVTTF